MGRGKNLYQNENEVLARAWIAASIAGTDKTARRFMHTVRLLFIEKGPDTVKVPEGKYGFP